MAIITALTLDAASGVATMAVQHGTSEVTIRGLISPTGPVTLEVLHALALQTDTSSAVWVVSPGGLAPFPPQPHPSSSFDWSAGVWIDDLAAWQEDQLAAAKTARDATEYGPFTWNGHTFDGDEAAQRRLGFALAGAQAALAAGDTTWSVPWTLADNTTITLSAQDVVAVYTALATHNILGAHAAYDTAKVQIMSATSIPAGSTI